LPDTSFGLDGTFGSGLRQGFANTDSLPAYAVFDGSITRDLKLFPNDKTALRLTVVNIFDTPYELRSGTGIGVGAPQWGMRRGFFVGVSRGF
jgi:outer membrane receptor protein involved in Fe transport